MGFKHTFLQEALSFDVTIIKYFSLIFVYEESKFDPLFAEKYIKKFACNYFHINLLAKTLMLHVNCMIVWFSAKLNFSKILQNL